MEMEKHGLHVGRVSHDDLNKTLGTWQLWGIAVGLVISGEYFGWNYGWAIAGTLGFFVTSVFVAAMYTTFVFSFSELTTSIPHAGGPFAYARHALGPFGGYIAGTATLIEFLFAPQAIALAIGSYLNVEFAWIEPKFAAAGAFLVFMGLNVIGVQIAAVFELVVTLAAVFELLVFIGVVGQGFSTANLLKGGWSGQDVFSMSAVPGMFAAIPFAIWLFLGIEGMAMVAEEVKDPKRSIPIAYVTGILTLLLLAIGVMVVAGGSGDWVMLASVNDPLPKAMHYVLGENSVWTQMFVFLGMFGLIASFHGIILGYSRQIYALARANYLPHWFAEVHTRFKTPCRAILTGGLFGIAVILCDDLVKIDGHSLTANIVTLSVFGALLMYIVSMLSLLRLRKIEPMMERTYTVPCYPFFPIFALLSSLICFGAMIYFNVILAGIFFLLLASGYVIFTLMKRNREIAPLDDMLESSEELIIERQLRSGNAFQHTEKDL